MAYRNGTYVAFHRCPRLEPQGDAARRLVERLNNSKNMILIIGKTTWQDTDWVPFEIEYSVDDCGIPIMAAYPGGNYILAPAELRSLWPTALEVRINSKAARRLSALGVPVVPGHPPRLHQLPPHSTAAMNEADTCRRLIVPKLQAAGWETEPHRINEQVTFTDGRIVVAGVSIPCRRCAFARFPRLPHPTAWRERRKSEDNLPRESGRGVYLNYYK